MPLAIQAAASRGEADLYARRKSCVGGRFSDPNSNTLLKSLDLADMTRSLSIQFYGGLPLCKLPEEVRALKRMSSSEARFRHQADLLN